MVTLVSGMIIGATIMYVFDEHRGAKRRAFARDKLVRATHSLGRQAKKRGRDLVNRGIGAVAELGVDLRDRLRSLPDDQLVDRVRSQLGHVVSHSGLLNVQARNGVVTVSGPVLEPELERIRQRMGKIRGVKAFRLAVEPHTDADVDRISGLRGARQSQAI
jgi:hypothetical protein